MKPLRLLPLLVLACTVATEPVDRPPFATQAEPAILLGAGDIARCGTGKDFPSSANKSRETSDLLVARPTATVFLLGDNTYNDGDLWSYEHCYHPTWGRVKDRTLFPVPGNHEYHTVTQPAGAPGYFDYFGAAAGERGKGYWARDFGGARVYGLNSELSGSARTAQVTWLKADLAANPRACQVALVHRPVKTTTYGGGHTGSLNLVPVWDALVAGGAELLLSGHNHFYERFARMRSDGTLDPKGLRQIIAGTGGSGTPSTLPVTVAPGSEAFGNQHGVLQLAIYPDRIVHTFIPIAGKTYTDEATTLCDGSVPPPPPPPPPDRSIPLTVTGRVDATKTYAALSWSGALGTSVDVFRNGALIKVTENDGHYTNSRSIQPTPQTYTYTVCEQQQNGLCSNTATVSFP